MAEINYGSNYSESNFWKKIKRFAKKAGSKVIYPALVLYYTLQKEDLPPWAKTVIIGALGYFILPLDGITDLAPFIGYTDDLGALLGAMATVATYIDEDAKTRAKNKLSEWFKTK